jgi:hypothetical protein
MTSPVFCWARTFQTWQDISTFPWSIRVILFACKIGRAVSPQRTKAQVFRAQKVISFAMEELR